jgi:hypothetical protein
MEKVDVKFGEWIEEGFNLYKINFGTLVLVSVIALALSTVTIGILAGPMIAGLAIVTLQLLRKEEPEPDAGKVFRGFDHFLNAFLFVVIWGIAILVGSIILGIFPCIGQLLSLFLVYAAQSFLMFGIFLIVDKQMSFWPASIESIQTVNIVLTIPIQVCILAVAYRDVFNEVKRPSTSDFTQSADPV